MKAGWLTIALVVLIANSAMAQLDKTTEVEGITEYNLENGVKLLLFPDNSKPQFTMNLSLIHISEPTRPY